MSARRHTLVTNGSALPLRGRKQSAEGSPLSPLALLDFWHLLSLDAPTVAAVWLLFVGSSTRSGSQSRTAVALFIAVWIVYAGDRLLDANALPHLHSASGWPSELELRHHFHHRYRRRFWLLLLCLVPALCWLLYQLPARILILETVLAVLLAGWLLWVHGPWIVGTSQRLPKELIVGLFFAMAVYIPLAVSLPNQLPLLPGAILFASLCTLNCLFLYAWEHPGDLSRAHPATAFAVRHLQLISWLDISAAALAWYMERGNHLGEVPLACSLSTLLLLSLHANRDRFPPLRLRALADFVLLTPLPFFLLRGLCRHGCAAYR